MALENIHELALGVFSVDSRFVDGKNGIVIGKRAALAIDGSNYEDEGAAMASFIRQAAIGAGIPAEDVAAQIEFDEFIGDRLPKNRNGMPQRHLNTVAKIVEEEMERRDNTSHRSSQG